MALLQKFNFIFTPSEKKKIAVLFIGIVFMGLFELVGVSSIAPFMAVISTPEIIHENYYLNVVYHLSNANNDNDFIVFLGIGVIVLLLISNAFQAFTTWQIAFFTQLQTHRLSTRLLNHYLELPYSFYLNRNTSDLAKNILTEVERCVDGIVYQGLQILSKVIIVLFLSILLFLVDWVVALSATLIFTSSYWLIYKLVKERAHTFGVGSTKALFLIYKAANEAMSGIKDIKLRDQAKEFTSRFFTPSKDVANYRAKSTLISSLPRYFLEITAFGSIVAMIILFTMQEGGSDKVFPIVSLYALAGYRLLPALQQIYSGVTQIKYHFPALDIIINDLQITHQEKIYNDQLELEFNSALIVSNLSYQYPGSKNFMLTDINLKILPNTTVGLVGETGSGKTTLIDILLGLLSPISGSMRVDDAVLTHQSLKRWQKILGYVPQAIYLTDDTIANNIAFAVPKSEVNMNQVKKVAKLANLDDFITTLPEQYDTFVGERGIRLSGGQRQRIGIARALYHNPKVLVLDEATSALDGVTENAIMDAIHNLAHKKTIIMIAHRLSTVKECDVIYMMNDGSIVDSGTYEQLIENNEHFRKMAKSL